MTPAAVACLALLAAAAPAHAGTLTPEGFTTAGVAADGGVYMGIGAADGASWRRLGIYQNRDNPVQFTGYAPAPQFQPGLGSCSVDAPGHLDCGVIPTGGEPFHVTGSDRDDDISELACNSAGQPDNTPCPRVFKVRLNGGNDFVKTWNFASSLADTPDPSTGLRPFVATGRAPMHGVEISGGAGNDVIILAGGPTSGRIDGGAGDDQIFTKGGYSEAGELVTGPYTIVCGPGNDVVEPGPNDIVARDCERAVSGGNAEPDPRAEPEPSGGFDVASTCGTAKFTFYSVSGERGFVRKGRRACVYLVSNRMARQLVKMAYNSKGNVTDAFVEVLGVAARAAKEVDPNSETLEKWIGDRLPHLPSRWELVEYVVSDFVRDAHATAGRANPLLLVGESAGLLAIPLRTLHRIHQIEAKGACLQFVVGVRDRTAHVDSKIVYNPTHFTGRTGTYARVNRRDRRLGLDRYPAEYLNLSCGRDGMVRVTPRRDTGAVFSGDKTVTGRR
ncbi:MAG: hypothetical protein AB1416_02555 [Actinomycetota bacterium]